MQKHFIFLDGTRERQGQWPALTKQREKQGVPS